jgi:hypothetical protein
MAARPAPVGRGAHEESRPVSLARSKLTSHSTGGQLWKIRENADQGCRDADRCGDALGGRPSEKSPAVSRAELRKVQDRKITAGAGFSSKDRAGVD